MALPELSVAQARRLLMGAQDLLDDPMRRAGKAALGALVDRLGFVQLDTINVLERAHHLTLHSRLDGYRQGHLEGLIEDRRLFEAFTHDASFVPAPFYPQWKPRFRRDAERLRASAWFQHHFRGTSAEEVIGHVRERVAAEGPLKSSDFEHPEKRGPWWGWKPHKAALDFLWRTGEFAIAGREQFQKRYDLAERVHPEGHAAPEPGEAEHVAWACGTALARLGVATSRELAEFWDSIGVADAKAWAEAEATAGRLARVQLEGVKGAAYAVPDWEARLREAPEAPARTRLLCPFDPVLRDRARALRLFGFDYRFEAFVPEPKRRYGYFVLPILEGERLVGRLDPKLHRDRGVLEVKGLWWEPGVKATKARKQGLEAALARLAAFVGAGDIVWARGSR
ncbi:MAG: crosslink repair DNA glycosylase YcaQ family protein [Holophagaceae bacterium]